MIPTESSGVVHLWEYRGALETIERQKTEIASLKKYAWYLSVRMQEQAKVINDKVSPIVAASIFDDLDDAATMAGIEPRTWEPPK